MAVRTIGRQEWRRRTEVTPALWVGVFLTGIYGGYFGAAQGILLLAIMGVLLTESLQRINGVKNVLATLANAVAAVVLYSPPKSIGWGRRWSRQALSSAARLVPGWAGGCRPGCCARSS
jgi:uncharacterized membrane protein YfcA